MRRRLDAIRFPVGLGAAALLAAMTSTGRAQEHVDFNRDIRPLLSENCLICHGPDEQERKAGLRLDTEVGSREDLGGHAAVVPGEAGASELIERLATDDEELRMPPAGKGRRFNDAEIRLVRRWIDQGAHYAAHWSYVKPWRPQIPEITNSDWPLNPIDHFILARLQAEGLDPSPAADRLTLARRVSLDLTGLPPTWEEAKRFAEDGSKDAYETYVDRLLAQPAFGERWAQVWLDLARYADSAGYADDPPRTIWAYRDYVIRSLNDNKPFDQFTIEQIAGDLIENPSEEQLIATAFHRNTTTNSEGGTNDEEFRNVAVVDRVNTTMAVWMGTTMACAQCHTHKYDPITQREYFEFFAIFNHTEDADRKDEEPVLEIWSDEKRKQQMELQSKIVELQSRQDLSEPIAEQLQEQQQKNLASLTKQLSSLVPETTVPVMRERPADQKRTTHVQLRGSYLSHGEQVSGGTPAAFHTSARQAGESGASGGQVDRMSLAHWLVDEDNPLTSRVIANRHWEQIFGMGLVGTPPIAKCARFAARALTRRCKPW